MLQESHSWHAGSLVRLETCLNVGCERELIDLGRLARPLCLQWHSRPILHGLGFPVLPMGHELSRRLAVTQSPMLQAVLPDMFFLPSNARSR